MLIPNCDDRAARAKQWEEFEKKAAANRKKRMDEELKLEEKKRDEKKKFAEDCDEDESKLRKERSEQAFKLLKEQKYRKLSH